MIYLHFIQTILFKFLKWCQLLMVYHYLNRLYFLDLILKDLLVQKEFLPYLRSPLDTNTAQGILNCFEK